MQIIVFEEIKPIHSWLIKVYGIFARDIFFLRLNKACKDEKVIDQHINCKRIKKIYLDDLISGHEGFYYDSAFKSINAFSRIFRDKAIVEYTARLYKNDATIMAYQKTFNEALARFYYLNHLMYLLSEKYHGADVILLPSNGIQGYRTDGCEIFDYFRLYKQAKKIGVQHYGTNFVRFPWWAIAVSYMNAFKRKINVAVKIIAFLGWCFVKAIFSFRKRPAVNLKSYKYVSLIVSPKRQFANKIQRVDFFVDNDLIKKEDTIFLSYNKLGYKEKLYLEENHLDYLDNLEDYVFPKEITRIFPGYIVLLFSFFTTDSKMLETGLKGLYFYIIWEGFARHVRFNRFITCSGTEIKSIFRNIVFQNHGCITYQYMDSANSSFFIEKNGSKNKLSFLLGFLYGDYFISWNDTLSGFLKYIHYDFKHFINVGCLWAEHLRLIQEGEIDSDIKVRLYSKGYREGMKIISVFDSSFNDDCLVTYGDAIKFLEGIYSLVQDMPNVFVVFKEKNRRSCHKAISVKYGEIITLHKRFEDHPRCYLPGEEESSSGIMAFSDVSISFPFTSTTFEALSARKKAVWYDATDKFRDTYYDSIPGLVLHNYEELLIRVKALLFEISEDEYANYLELYVKGKVESYLDGKAITRFRNILNNPSMIPKIEVRDNIFI